MGPFRHIHLQGGNVTENRCNLIDEPWIPIPDHGRVSLRQAFSVPLPASPGGSPLNKISVFKLLEAMAQAACTPENDEEWLALGPQGLADKALAYLEKHYDKFWLHGERPFLQLKACAKAELKSCGTVMPDVASGNTTWIFHQQLEPELDDADKALLLLGQLSLCLGGKKPDNKLVLSPGYEKKASGRPGPAVCHMGLLHSFLLGGTLLETLWLNLLTREDIAGQKQWESGLGTPPWEVMPEGEDCPAARALKSSLMGRLVPMARFCLLDGGGVRFTEGIAHPDYQSGMIDPSAAMDASKAKPRALWANPEIRPWRQLPALLSFLDAQRGNSGFYCLGLQKGMDRVKKYRDRLALGSVGVWSGGVRVSRNAGEQYLTGKDDELESEARFDVAHLNGAWFLAFRALMEDVEKRGRLLYGAVNGYCKAMKMDDASSRGTAAEAVGLFWQLVEPFLPEIIDGCENPEARAVLLGRCRGLLLRLYDDACPHGTGRQAEEWIKHRPRSGEGTRMENIGDRHAALLAWVQERLGPSPKVRDTGSIARLKRADGSERLAVQAWDLLLRFNVKDQDIAPCLALLAPLCRRDDPADGTASLGRALASCADDKESGSIRLRRLLNCGGVDELCMQLRPLLAFIDSRAKEKLSYARLLGEALAFRSPDRRQEIKMRWAKDYWNTGNEETAVPDGEGA